MRHRFSLLLVPRPQLQQYRRVKLVLPFTKRQAPFTIRQASLTNQQGLRAKMAQEYKLKNVTYEDLKPGKMLEAEVEGIEDGKVLLVLHKGEIQALSPNCTHYGAPLKNGVLTSDGRLTCPWHGACFDVKSGDVEDAPALDPIANFEIVQKDGGLYIKGEESVIKAKRRHLDIKCSTKSQDHVVILGGGSGTVGVIENLRAGGYPGQITVLSREGVRPIDRTKLSKALIAETAKVAWRSEDFYKDASIDIQPEEATGINFGSKTISTKSGKSFSYTKLVLATGGDPRSLPLSGLRYGDLSNVFLMRTVSDAAQIVSAIGDAGGKKVVVIGSSFIGMEVGNALAARKNDVSIIGMESVPMERVMGAKVGAIFQAMLEKNGIKFHMQASVDKATPAAGDPKTVGAVHLKDGTVLEADVVVEGVGVAPATAFLRGSTELSLEKDGSIAVDDAFRVPGLADVYAIGDIATYPYRGPGGGGKPVRIEHWNVAQNAGRAVARSILHPGANGAAPFIPVFWSALGSQLRYCGNTVNGYDDVLVQGDTEKPSWIAFYAKEGTVVAVASMGKDPYVMQAAELMRKEKMPTLSELQSGKDIMEMMA